MAEMTDIRQSPPSPRRVALLMPPGGQLIALIGMIEALDAANRIRAAREQTLLYDPCLVGLGDRTPSAAGPVVQTVPSASVAPPHTLVVGGSLEHVDRRTDVAVLREVERLADGAERIVAVCAGAFLLGDLGLLDARRCTSHWLALDSLRDRFPAAHVEEDALFTEDGRVFTSAGATAGIDLALHLIRKDGGARLALSVARALVVFAQRPGGQSQFGSTLRLRPGLDDRLRRLVGHVVSDPGGDHRVHLLAEQIGMSPRHFARVFRAQTGETPAAFVSRVRVEAAQRALVHSDASVSAVADDCGFGTVETLRRTFQRIVGVTPSAYRDRFRIGVYGGAPIASEQ